MNGYNSYRSNRNCPCQRCRINDLWGPAMLVTIGILFLLQNLGVVGFHNSWPVILLVAGGIMFARNSASPLGHIPRYAIYAVAPPPVAATQPAPGGSQDLTTPDQGR